jgi:hypothetical protein
MKVRNFIFNLRPYIIPHFSDTLARLSDILLRRRVSLRRRFADGVFWR